MVTLEEIVRAVEASWSRETSALPEKWSKEKPSMYQCISTALVIQDFFGGRILRVRASGPFGSLSHYYNELDDGRTIDLTRKAFPEGTTFSEPEVRERIRLLSFQSNADGYEALRNAVLSILKTDRLETDAPKRLKT